MTRYQYAGPGPIEPDGEIIRPGDVREFDQEPEYGPWECIDPPPEADEGGTPPGPPGASPAATGAAPALNLAPAPAAAPEGM